MIAREYSGILAFGYALMSKRRRRDLGLGTACSPPAGASSPKTVTQILTRPFILHAGDAGKDENERQKKNRVYNVDFSHL